LFKQSKAVFDQQKKQYNDELQFQKFREDLKKPPPVLHQKSSPVLHPMSPRLPSGSRTPPGNAVNRLELIAAIIGVMRKTIRASKVGRRSATAHKYSFFLARKRRCLIDASLFPETTVKTIPSNM